MDDRVRVGAELLLGYRRRQSAIYLAYAAVVAALAFVVTASVWAGVAVFGFERFRGLARPLLLGVCGLGAALAGLQGYTNDGLLVGAILALAPFAGFLAWGSVGVGLDLPSPAAGQAGFDRIVLLGAAAGLVLAFLGLGVGRLVSSDPERNVRVEASGGG